MYLLKGMVSMQYHAVAGLSNHCVSFLLYKGVFIRTEHLKQRMAFCCRVCVGKWVQKCHRIWLHVFDELVTECATMKAIESTQKDTNTCTHILNHLHGREKNVEQKWKTVGIRVEKMFFFALVLHDCVCMCLSMCAFVLFFCMQNSPKRWRKGAQIRKKTASITKIFSITNMKI